MTDRQRTSSSEGNTTIGRDRWLVLGLVLLILAVTAACVLEIASGTRSLRSRNAMDRNESTARLCARLLDEQYDGALSVLQALIQKPRVTAHLQRRDQPALSQDLHAAVGLVPDLVMAAVYDPQGRLLQCCPDSLAPSGSAAEEPWFLTVSSERRVYAGEVIRLRDKENIFQALAMAIPVGDPDRPAGYLLAYFRLGDIYGWLRQVRVSGGAIQILDSSGRVIAQRTETPAIAAQPPLSSPALRLALAQQYGSMEQTEPAANGHTLQSVVIGYAYAERPGWAVLVSQPSATAFAPSDYLIRRMTLITVPLLALLSLCGWLLVSLYHRQLHMAGLLSQRNAALRRQDQAKTDLLANVSHDLKTPIASMQLSVSSLLESERGWDKEQAQECLTLVGQELDELSARVRNLLDMSRLEAKAAPDDRQPCDLADIVAVALERMRPLLGGHFVDARFPPEPLLVECAPTQMETLVMNLLENALKYSPPGAPLHLTGRIDDDRVVLTIRDEGPGVPVEERERIFDKFYRATTRHSAGGTGLGLAICRNIAEAHGGDIGVESPAGGGAEFVVRLPAIGDSWEDVE